MIEVKNLTKYYGDKHAVDGISFSVKQGEILGFLGPNGAGKSTTMNILTGYISSTSGEVKIGDYDILESPIEAKQKIGYLPELPPLYMDMTVQGYLSFVYDLKKCKIPKRQHIDDVCRRVRIDHVQKRLIKNLSKGYRQRVGLAQALIGNPEVLILDEPTVGLDPKQIIEIRDLIKVLGERHTVILSSHILSEVQAVCDRLVIINGGKIVADDTAENLTRKLSKDFRYIIRVEGPQEDVQKTLSSIPGMKEVLYNGEKEPGAHEFSLESDPTLDIRREVFHRMVSRNWTILSFRSTEMTLEDIFLQLTTGDAASAETTLSGTAEETTEAAAEPAADAEVEIIDPETGIVQAVADNEQVEMIEGFDLNAVEDGANATNENGGEE
jgi:ABC-2 type transport system ATP-binding protein